MSCDHILFDLAEGWALGFDDRQWLVMKGRSKNGGSNFRAVAFVASNKLVLMRVLDELGVIPTPTALRALDQLQERFRDWQNQQVSKNSRRHSGHKKRPPPLHTGNGLNKVSIL